MSLPTTLITFNKLGRGPKQSTIGVAKRYRNRNASWAHTPRELSMRPTRRARAHSRRRKRDFERGEWQVVCSGWPRQSVSVQLRVWAHRCEQKRVFDHSDSRSKCRVFREWTLWFIRDLIRSPDKSCDPVETHCQGQEERKIELYGSLRIVSRSFSDTPPIVITTVISIYADVNKKRKEPDIFISGACKIDTLIVGENVENCKLHEKNSMDSRRENYWICWKCVNRVAKVSRYWANPYVLAEEIRETYFN